MMLWHFVGLLLVVCLATIQGRVGSYGSLWMILLALPATILHEFSHYLVALVTGGNPQKFSIFPSSQMIETANGPRRVWTLGAVSFYPTTFSAAPTALAPLLFIPIAWFFYLSWFDWFPVTAINTLWLYLLIYLCLGAAVPSWPDFRIILKYPKSLIGYVGVLTLTYFAREPIAMAFHMVQDYWGKL